MIKDQYASDMPVEEECPECGEKLRRLRSPEGKEWLYCYCWGYGGHCQADSRKRTAPLSEKTEQ